MTDHEALESGVAFGKDKPKSDWIYRYNPDTFLLENTYEIQEIYEADSIAERIAAGRHNLFHSYLQENIYPNDVTIAVANAIYKLRGLGLLSALRENDHARAACLIQALRGQGFQIEPIRQLPEPKPVVHHMCCCEKASFGKPEEQGHAMRYVGKRVVGEILDRLAPVGTKISMVGEPIILFRASKTIWEYDEPGSISVRSSWVNTLWNNGGEGYVVIRWGWDEYPTLVEEER